MRLFLPLLILMAVCGNASAQTVDWKSLGKPIENDTKQMRDRYVYFNQEMVDQNIGIDKAALSKAEIGDWVKEHIGQILTLDGRSYDKTIIENQKLFTPTGYGDYVVYLKNANLDKFLKDNQYKMGGFVQGDPNITSEGIDKTKGAYSWQVTADIILSYLDYRNQTPTELFAGQDKSKISNRFPVRAQIELLRVPAKQGKDLIAIQRISFNQIK